MPFIRDYQASLNLKQYYSVLTINNKFVIIGVY